MQLKEKKAALERARRKGHITPFPGQNGFAIEGELSEGDGYDGEASHDEERNLHEAYQFLMREYEARYKMAMVCFYVKPKILDFI